MPRRYKKRRMRKKRSSGTPWYERKYNAKELAQKAWKTAKWLKSVVNVEKKVQDRISTGGLTSTGNVTTLTDILQGTGQSERDGTSIKMTSLLCRGNIVMNASATDTLVRHMWVIDNQQVGDSAPSVSDVLESVHPLSPLNKATFGRFTILRDELQSFSSVSNTQKVIHFSMPLQHHVRYNGTTASDIQKGGLYYISVSDEATNGPQIDIRMRLRYVDN